MPTACEKFFSVIRHVLVSFRRLLLVLLSIFVLFNLAGFFGVPYLLRYVAEQKLPPLLSRPVSVEKISFNPYTLRLTVEKFHIGEPEGALAFVDLDRLMISASWESLFRLSTIVDEVALDAPQIKLVRTAEQHFNFTDLIEKFSRASADEPKGTAEFSVANIRVSGGRIDFDDRMLGVRHAVDQLTLGIPVIANLPSFTNVYVQPLLQASIDGSPLRIEGRTKPFSATRESEVNLKLDRLDIPRYLSYVPTALPVKVSRGLLSADIVIEFAQVTKKPTLRIKARADIRDLSIKDKQEQAIADVARIHLDGLSIEPLDRVLNLKSVLIDHPALVLSRDKNGVLNLARLAGTAPKTKPNPKASAEAAFKFNVDSLDLKEADVGFTDLSNADPVKIRVAPLNITVQDISQDFSKPWAINVIGTLNGKGQFHTTGSVALMPLNASVKVDDDGMDVAAFEPYFGRFLNASLARAYLRLKGEVSASLINDDLNVSYSGDLGLNDVRMLDKATADLFAGWGALSVTQIRAAYSAAATDIQIGRVALAKFYARIFLDKNGQLNLSRIVARESASNTSLTRTDPAAETVSAPPTAPAPAAKKSGSTFNLRFGQISFDAGQVNFTDNFIKPNYSAALNQINGKIGAFGTKSIKPATVDVQAKLNASDRIAIRGSVNPLTPTPFVDLTASARDVVLTNFTPYSANYTGYPIIAGKLTVDLHYLLDNNQLNASNHIFIDQLTFGDHVDSPNATSLPVRLAVSLLKNARGEIDINLPVSGSLSDPKFSLGRVIWGIFVNLIEKAVTSPFTLLASAFGGGDELGYVEFAPGSSVLPDAALAKLGTLSKALADRPEIKLDLAGRIDPALDEPALREAYVERQIKLQKTKTLVGKGESIDPDTVSVTPEEYNKFLLRAYEAADFKKERNFIGILKSQPAEVMQKLLVANAPVTDAELLQLAQRRASVVQQWFDGKIDASRIYVVAPKLKAEGITDKGPTTRVEFGLK